MLLRAYAIYDNKSLVYSPPFFAATDGQAVRSLGDLVSDANTSVGRHPGDYVLFYVGTYDDAKGAMAAVSPLVHVIDAVSLVQLSPTSLPFKVEA